MISNFKSKILGQTMNSLEELIQGLPPDLEQEVKDFSLLVGETRT